MTAKSFGATLLGVLLGGLLFGGLVTYKTHEAVTTAGRSFGIVAKGFMPAALSDPEEAGDLEDLAEAKERLKVLLVAEYGEKK